MAVLAVQQIVTGGTNPSLQSANAGGDKVPPSPNLFLEVVNGSGGAVTVTVDSVVPSNYGTDVDQAVSVPAGGRRLIPIIPPERYTSPTDGMVNVAYSGVTSVTVGAFKI